MGILTKLLVNDRDTRVKTGILYMKCFVDIRCYYYDSVYDGKIGFVSSLHYTDSDGWRHCCGHCVLARVHITISFPIANVGHSKKRFT